MESWHAMGGRGRFEFMCFVSKLERTHTRACAAAGASENTNVKPSAGDKKADVVVVPDEDEGSFCFLTFDGAGCVYP